MLLTCRSVCRGTNSHVVNTGIPCRDSHCENGFVRCCLYTLRRLQQTAVSCERSNCNKIKNLESRILSSGRVDGPQEIQQVVRMGRMTALKKTTGGRRHCQATCLKKPSRIRFGSRWRRPQRHFSTPCLHGWGVSVLPTHFRP